MLLEVLPGKACVPPCPVAATCDEVATLGIGVAVIVSDLFGTPSRWHGCDSAVWVSMLPCFIVCTHQCPTIHQVQLLAVDAVAIVKQRQQERLL
jgi:hypothetical protein